MKTIIFNRMIEYGIQWDFSKYSRSSGGRNAVYREPTTREIELFKHCPVLSLLNNSDNKKYYKHIRSIVEKLTNTKFPNPEIEYKSFIRKMKANKKFLIPTDVKTATYHIDILPNRFDIYQFLYNFQESLNNTLLFFEVTKCVIRERKLIHNIELYEQLIVHFMPFLLPYKVEPRYEVFERQCIIMSLFEEFVSSYPEDLDQFPFFAERVINCFLFLIQKSRESIQMCAWRSIAYMLKSVIFRVPETTAVAIVENVVTEIIGIPQIHQMLYHLLVTMEDVVFLPIIYFSSQIFRRVEFDQRDLQNIMTLCRKNKQIKRPFPIMRYMLQHSIYPSEKTRICLQILNENKKYFRTCSFLVRFSRVYIKRSFQWLVIAQKANKYKRFRSDVVYNIYTVYKLDLPYISEAIEVAASSLLYYYPNFPDVVNYFKIGRVEPQFQMEFKYLHYNMDELKKLLLYPAGCFKAQKDPEPRIKQYGDGSDDDGSENYEVGGNHLKMKSQPIDRDYDDELTDENAYNEVYVQFEFPPKAYSSIKANYDHDEQLEKRKKVCYLPMIIFSLTILIYFIWFFYFKMEYQY